jgi:hypothetical protein
MKYAVVSLTTEGKRPKTVTLTNLISVFGNDFF